VGCGDDPLDTLTKQLVKSEQQLSTANAELARLKSQLDQASSQINTLKEQASSQINTLKEQAKVLSRENEALKASDGQAKSVINKYKENDSEYARFEANKLNYEQVHNDLIMCKQALSEQNENIAKYHAFMKKIGPIDMASWVGGANVLPNEDFELFSELSLLISLPKIGFDEAIVKFNPKYLNPTTTPYLMIGSVKINAERIVIDQNSKYATAYFPNAKGVETTLIMSQEKQCSVVFEHKTNDIIAIFKVLPVEEKRMSKTIPFELVGFHAGSVKFDRVSSGWKLQN
jgi:hypothetical protein